MDIAKLLDNVGALPGVEGTCVFELGGEVRINRLSALGSEALLESMRSGITDLYLKTTAHGLATDDFVLHFGDRWLLLRRAGEVILVVLAGPAANLSSVRMLTNILVRNLTPDALEALSALPLPPPSPSVSASPESEPKPDPDFDPDGDAPLSPKKPVRMYRGQPY